MNDHKLDYLQVRPNCVEQTDARKMRGYRPEACPNCVEQTGPQGRRGNRPEACPNSWKHESEGIESEHRNDDAPDSPGTPRVNIVQMTPLDCLASTPSGPVRPCLH